MGLELTADIDIRIWVFGLERKEPNVAATDSDEIAFCQRHRQHLLRPSAPTAPPNAA